jgi:hypothetical protein
MLYRVVDIMSLAADLERSTRAEEIFHRSVLEYLWVLALQPQSLASPSALR